MFLLTLVLLKLALANAKLKIAMLKLARRRNIFCKYKFIFFLQNGKTIMKSNNTWYSLTLYCRMQISYDKFPLCFKNSTITKMLNSKIRQNLPEKILGTFLLYVGNVDILVIQLKIITYLYGLHND